MRLGGDAGDHEDQVEALGGQPLVQGGDASIVVDVGGLDAQRLRAQAARERGRRALGRGDPPAPRQEGLDEAEPRPREAPTISALFWDGIMVGLRDRPDKV